MKVLLIEPMEYPKEIDIQPTLEEYYKVLDCDWELLCKGRQNLPREAVTA